MAYLLLAIAIISEVTATSALKACNGFTRLLPSLMVVAGYCVSFFTLSQVVKLIPLNTPQMPAWPISYAGIFTNLGMRL